jgi:hypothetical protein
MSNYDIVINGVASNEIMAKTNTPELTITPSIEEEDTCLTTM